MTDTPRTPRLASAFPQTPPARRTPWGGRSDTPARSRSPAKRVSSSAKTITQDTNPPLISFDAIDAPSQRLYVVAFYAALHAWRIYEWWTSSDGIDATWLFLKWVSIDGVFLFGLPSLRIPWLEWAFSTTLAVFLVHAALDIFLMFRIPVRLSTFPDPTPVCALLIATLDSRRFLDRCSR